MPYKLMRFESARKGSISKTHGNEHGYGYDDTADIASYVDPSLSKSQQNYEHASNRQMKLDMARTNTRTMTKDERSALKNHYYRANRRANGLSAG